VSWNHCSVKLPALKHTPSTVSLDVERTQESASKSTKISTIDRGIAYGLAAPVLVTLIVLVLNPRSMDSGTLSIVRFLAAGLAGISAYCFTGTLGLEAKFPLTGTQLKATGSFAAFIIVLLIFFYGVPSLPSSNEVSLGKTFSVTPPGNKSLPDNTPAHKSGVKLKAGKIEPQDRLKPL
jgi:hypothetical protein